MGVQRRAVLLTALVLVQAALSAQGTSVEDLPHAVPREGAKRVLTNAWVTAWDATWIPNKPTAMHRHLYDYFGVELADSITNLIGRDSQARTVSLRRGQSWFIAKGATHLEIGLTADPPRRAILVDLSDMPSPAYDNSTTFPVAFPPDGAQKVVDNRRVVMWDQAWPPGQPGSMHFYPRNVVLMFVDGGELTFSAPGAPTQVSSFATGEVLFLPGGRARAVQATSTTVRAIVVELK